MKRLLIVNVLLLAIVVVLVVQIFALRWRAEAVVEAVVPREAKPQRLDTPPVARQPPPPDLAASIAEKDLFDVSRAPEPPATFPSAGPSPAPPLTLALVGIMGPPGDREALVKDQAQPKPLWLREGEEFSGYKVSRIEPTSIVMVTPTGDEVTLMINVEKAKGAPQLTGPGGVPPPPTPGARRVMHPTPAVTPAPPAGGIKEKIERLREEARKRRGQPRQY